MQLHWDISEEVLDVSDWMSKPAPSHSGARVFFVGIVRGANMGKEVDHLHYEAEIRLSRKLAEKILREATERFGLTEAIAEHRIGKISPGEAAVFVITSSAHRKEAYEANQEIIHRLKHEVPIWKKEVFTDGSSQWGDTHKC